MKLHLACAVVGFWSLVLCMAAQTSGTSPLSTQVPPLIQFSNVATDEGGNTLSGVASITFSLYTAQRGGEPLWTERQHGVLLDSTGYYSVMLGVTKPNGMPTALFTSGEARWLGVRIAEQKEQPRVLLLSVPYALKAGDAATIGGLPPSAFVLAATPSGSIASTPLDGSITLQTSAPQTTGGPVTGTGTASYLPLWDSASDIVSSVVSQAGTGNTAKIGINTATPATTLDVKGSATIRGTLSLPATGKATASVGANSQPLSLAVSAFNSSSSTALNQTFQWQAEPAANNTGTPSGTLNLLFGEGATKPSETGLELSSTGLFTFAPGQTFPGTGSVTSVGSGAGLSGGPITAIGSLSIATAGVTNAMLANPSLTITAGTDLTGGGVVSLGGSTTLSLDRTKVPQLAGNNTFTGRQTINNTTIMSGTSTNGVLQVTNTVASGGGPAIVGTTDSSGGTGVKGIVAATTGITAGVYGQTSSPDGRGVHGSGGKGVVGTSTIGPLVGVYGVSNGASKQGAGSEAAGVWGDTNGIGYVALLGTADDAEAAILVNNSKNAAFPTLSAVNFSRNASSLIFNAESDTDLCTIDVRGNFSCSGSKSSVVPVDGASRRVALYTVEAPENWFEDAGSGQLSHGLARINLDPTFAQTVNTAVDYHVFLTPKGDCKGLYVSHESATSFEVHELGGGISNIAFDYRIMAKRSGYENIRLADLTEKYKRLALKREQLRRRQSGPRTAQP